MIGVGAIVIGLAAAGLVASSKYWVCTWAIIPVIALAGPIITVGSADSGISLVGVDLSILLLLLLAIKGAKASPTFWALSLGLVLCSSIPLMVGVSVSVSSSLSAFKVLLAIVIATLAGYRSVARSIASLRWLFVGLCMFLLLVGILLIIRYEEQSSPVLQATSDVKQFLLTPIGGSNYVAAIAVLAMAGSLFLSTSFGKLRIPSFLVINILAFSVVFLSQSKWGVGVGGVVVLLNAAVIGVQTRGLLGRVLVVLVLIASFLLGAKVLLSGKLLQEIVTTGFDVSSSSSALGRLDIWQVAWFEFSRAPFFGNGLGWKVDFYGQSVMAHNTWLEILIQGGFLLLIPLCALWAYIMIQALKSAGITILPLVVAGLASGILEPTLMTGLYDVLLFSILGFAVGYGNIPASTKKVSEGQTGGPSTQLPGSPDLRLIPTPAVRS